MPGRDLRAVAALAALALVLTACSVTPSTTPTTAIPSQAPLADLPLLDDPRAFEGPSTAVLPNAEIAPLDPRPEQVLDGVIMLMERIQAGRGHSQLRTKRDSLIAAQQAEEE